MGISFLRGTIFDPPSPAGKKAADKHLFAIGRSGFQNRVENLLKIARRRPERGLTKQLVNGKALPCEK